MNTSASGSSVRPILYEKHLDIVTDLNLDMDEMEALVDILMDWGSFKYDREHRIVYAKIGDADVGDHKYNGLAFHFRKK